MKKIVRKLFNAFVPMAIVSGLAACHEEVPTLNLLVWEGYADPSFTAAFENDHHCKITASYMGSSDELVAKLRGGSAANYDIISPSSDVATVITQSHLAAPIDVTHITSFPDISRQLKDLPLVKMDGQIFGVPLTWGPDPLLYDTTAFKTVPTSWKVLWEPAYRGKISVWDDLSTIYMAAQVLGYDKPNPGAIYNLTDEQLANVKKKLIELKPNIRKMWATGGELTNLFQNHEIVAAMGWPLMANQLRKANFPIGETIPNENTTGWIDHLMIPSASQHKELAMAFIAYMVQAQTQKKLTDITGSVPANPKAAQFMDENVKHGLHLDDVDKYMARLYFWQNVPRRDKYNEVWNEVKAAQ